MESLLLEIGTEEIPARFISTGVASLREALTGFFREASIDHGKVTSYATPRRLAISIEDVAEKQNDRVTEVVGPPRKVAFDSNGTPTKAATGFARSMNMDVKDLKVIRTERGEYVAALIKEKGRATKEVLSTALPELISSLRFPKTMRWGDGSLRFVRPIRWILAIFGKETIPFEIDGLRSNNLSYGHRFMSPGAIKIEDPSSYVEVLRQSHVIVDPEERRQIILEGIKEIEAARGCKVQRDEELLDTVTSLVEYPVLILGDFDSQYLSLPKELITTVMKAHQKYFAIEDRDSNLLPHFVVVSNTDTGDNSIVRRGAERVLRARLEDARFYYVEDQKRPLWDYVERLKKVTFHERIGSLYEKVERMASLCSFMAEEMGLQEKEMLLRAARLSKADLVTGVVREFPELQGYMGMIYALNSGEDRDVATAIYEHYLPKSSADSLPSGEMGCIISLADKLDNIASFFFLDLIPTGSEDPFALRRQASGVISILYEKDMPLYLDVLIRKALQTLKDYSPPIEELTDKILNFFYQRIEGILLGQGYGHDIVGAVLLAGFSDLRKLKLRIEALSILRTNPEFLDLLTAAKRVYNILTGVRPVEVKEGLFTEAAEKVLYETVRTVTERLKEGKFEALFELKGPINTFFDSVLVMDKRPEIKENRLALLSSVRGCFDSLADFSKIIS